MARDERTCAGARVLPSLMRALASRDPSAALSDQVPLEIPSLQLTDVDELCGRPTLSRDWLATFLAQLQRLTDRCPDHLAGLLKRSTLSLHFGQLGHMRIDKAGLVALEDRVELGGAHR